MPALPSRTRATLFGLLAIVLWSSVVGLIRSVSEGLGPIGGAAMIYSVSAVFLLVALGVPKWRSFPRPYLIVGSLLFSRYSERFPSGFFIGAIALLALSLLLLLPAAGSESHLTVLCIFWGMAIMAIGLSMQAKVLSLAPDATDVAMAIFSGLYNFGIGSGALLGNQVSLHLGMGNIGFVAAPLALIALGWCLLSFYRNERLQQHPSR